MKLTPRPTGPARRPLAGFDAHAIAAIRPEVWYAVAAVAQPVCNRSPRTVRAWLTKPGCVLASRPAPGATMGERVISGASLLAFAGHLVLKQAGRAAAVETKSEVRRRAEKVLAGIK